MCVERGGGGGRFVKSSIKYFPEAHNTQKKTVSTSRTKNENRGRFFSKIIYGT